MKRLNEKKEMVVVDSNPVTRRNTKDDDKSRIGGFEIEQYRQNLALIEYKDDNVNNNVVVYEDGGEKGINSEKGLMDIFKEKKLEDLRDNKEQDLSNLFSSEFEYCSESFVDKELLDEVIELCKEGIVKEKIYSDINQGLINTIIIHIRIIILYALFIEWVASNFDKSLLTPSGYRVRLVVSCVKRGLEELGVDYNSIENLDCNINKLNFNVDNSMLEWVVKIGENKGCSKSITYSEILNLLESCRVLRKISKKDFLALITIIGCYKSFLNIDEKVYSKLCTEILSIPEDGSDKLKRMKKKVNYHVGINERDIENFIKSILTRINLSCSNLPFSLYRKRIDEGGGYGIHVDDKSCFTSITKYWNKIVVDRLLNKDEDNCIKKIGSLSNPDLKHKIMIIDKFRHVTEDKLFQEKMLKTFDIKELVFMLNNMERPSTNFFMGRSERLKGSSRYTIDIMILANDERIPLYVRELNIESYILAYEANYFMHSVEEGNHSAMITLHREARKLVTKRVSLLCNDYSINNYRKLVNRIEDTTAQGVMIIQSIGVETVSNLIFSKSVKALCGDNSVTQQRLCFILADAILTYAVRNKRNIVKDLKDNGNTTLLNLFVKYKLSSEWTDTEKVVLGSMLLDCVVKTNVFDVEIDKEEGKTVKNISIKREFSELLSKQGFGLTRLPMIWKPVQWKDCSHISGGYYNNHLNYVNNMVGVVHNSPNYSGVVKPNKFQYDAVNYLSSIRFKINQELLDLLLNEWDKKDSLLFDGYNSLHPDSERMNKEDSEGRKYSKSHKKAILSHNQRYWIHRSILVSATIFQNLDIYFPCFLDFRGRIYSYIPYLNYQGSDLARALLLFSKNGKITDENKKYLFYYTSNVFGIGNKTYDERLHWCDTELGEYLRLVESDDKRDYEELIRRVSIKAKEPLQFLASLLAIKKAERTGYSDQPILFDATCSGLQHLAALCGDVVLAKHVNVIGDESIRNDMYLEACKYLNTQIESLKGLVKDELSGIAITRASVKKGIMTIPYGISVTSLNNDLQEIFEASKVFENKKLFISIPGKFTKDGYTKLISGESWGKLVVMIFNTLYSMHPVLKDFTDYLKGMSKVLLDLGAPIVWITPSGMKINNTSIKFKPLKVKCPLLKNNYPVTISIPTDKADKIACLNGVTPNLIHSLDSSNIHILIQNILSNPDRLKSENYINLYTIHDCFATTVDSMAEIEYLVRKSFASMYFGDKSYIYLMHDNFILQIKSFTKIYKDVDGIEYIIINDKKHLIPTIPKNILDNLDKNLGMLRLSVINSPYMIN